VIVTETCDCRAGYSMDNGDVKNQQYQSVIVILRPSVSRGVD
jgi:hypothetical protein